MPLSPPSSATQHNPSVTVLTTGPARGRRRLRTASAIGAALVAATLSTAPPSQASTATGNSPAAYSTFTAHKTAAAYDSVITSKAAAVSLTQHPTIAQGVLSIINQERWANRLPALSMNTKLISSAYSHNVAMARQNTMSHQCSGEAPLGDRIDAAHYNWSTAGENLGWNSDMSTAGAYALQVMMYNEKAPNDGHRLITLSRAYRNVGISVVTDTTHHKLWLTADFGHLM